MLPTTALSLVGATTLSTQRDPSGAWVPPWAPALPPPPLPPATLGLASAALASAALAPVLRDDALALALARMWSASAPLARVRGVLSTSSSSAAFIGGGLEAPSWDKVTAAANDARVEALAARDAPLPLRLLLDACLAARTSASRSCALAAYAALCSGRPREPIATVLRGAPPVDQPASRATSRRASSSSHASASIAAAVATAAVAVRLASHRGATYTCDTLASVVEAAKMHLSLDARLCAELPLHAADVVREEGGDLAVALTTDADVLLATAALVAVLRDSVLVGDFQSISRVFFAVQREQLAEAALVARGEGGDLRIVRLAAALDSLTLGDADALPDGGSTVSEAWGSITSDTFDASSALSHALSLIAPCGDDKAPPIIIAACAVEEVLAHALAADRARLCALVESIAPALAETASASSVAAVESVVRAAHDFAISAQRAGLPHCASIEAVIAPSSLNESIPTSAVLEVCAHLIGNAPAASLASAAAYASRARLAEAISSWKLGDESNVGYERAAQGAVSALNAVEDLLPPRCFLLNAATADALSSDAALARRAVSWHHSEARILATLHATHIGGTAPCSLMPPPSSPSVMPLPSSLRSVRNTDVTLTSPSAPPLSSSFSATWYWRQGLSSLTSALDDAEALVDAPFGPLDSLLKSSRIILLLRTALLLGGGVSNAASATAGTSTLLAGGRILAALNACEGAAWHGGGDGSPGCPGGPTVSSHFSEWRDAEWVLSSLVSPSSPTALACAALGFPGGGDSHAARNGPSIDSIHPSCSRELRLILATTLCSRACLALASALAQRPVISSISLASAAAGASLVLSALPELLPEDSTVPIPTRLSSLLRTSRALLDVREAQLAHAAWCASGGVRGASLPIPQHPVAAAFIASASSGALSLSGSHVEFTQECAAHATPAIVSLVSSELSAMRLAAFHDDFLDTLTASCSVSAFTGEPGGILWPPCGDAPSSFLQRAVQAAGNDSFGIEWSQDMEAAVWLRGAHLLITARADTAAQAWASALRASDDCDSLPTAIVDELTLIALNARHESICGLLLNAVSAHGRICGPPGDINVTSLSPSPLISAIISSRALGEAPSPASAHLLHSVALLARLRAATLTDAAQLSFSSESSRRVLVDAANLPLPLSAEVDVSDGLPAHLHFLGLHPAVRAEFALAARDADARGVDALLLSEITSDGENGVSALAAAFGLATSASELRACEAAVWSDGDAPELLFWTQTTPLLVRTVALLIAAHRAWSVAEGSASGTPSLLALLSRVRVAGGGCLITLDRLPDELHALVATSAPHLSTLPTASQTRGSATVEACITHAASSPTWLTTHPAAAPHLMSLSRSCVTTLCTALLSCAVSTAEHSGGGDALEHAVAWCDAAAVAADGPHSSDPALARASSLAHALLLVRAAARAGDGCGVVSALLPLLSGDVAARLAQLSFTPQSACSVLTSVWLEVQRIDSIPSATMAVLHSSWAFSASAAAAQRFRDVLSSASTQLQLLITARRSPHAAYAAEECTDAAGDVSRLMAALSDAATSYSAPSHTASPLRELCAFVHNVAEALQGHVTFASPQPQPSMLPQGAPGLIAAVAACRRGLLALVRVGTNERHATALQAVLARGSHSPPGDSISAAEAEAPILSPRTRGLLHAARALALLREGMSTARSESLNAGVGSAESAVEIDGWGGSDDFHSVRMLCDPTPVAATHPLTLAALRSFSSAPPPLECQTEVNAATATRDASAVALAITRALAPGVSGGVLPSLRAALDAGAVTLSLLHASNATSEAPAIRLARVHACGEAVARAWAISPIPLQRSSSLAVGALGVTALNASVQTFISRCESRSIALEAHGAVLSALADAAADLPFAVRETLERDSRGARESAWSDAAHDAQEQHAILFLGLCLALSTGAITPRVSRSGGAWAHLDVSFAMSAGIPTAEGAIAACESACRASADLDALAPLCSARAIGAALLRLRSSVVHDTRFSSEWTAEMSQSRDGSIESIVALLSEVRAAGTLSSALRDSGDGVSVGGATTALLLENASAADASIEAEVQDVAQEVRSLDVSLGPLVTALSPHAAHDDSSDEFALVGVLRDLDIPACDITPDDLVIEPLRDGLGHAQSLGGPLCSHGLRLVSTAAALLPLRSALRNALTSAASVLAGGGDATRAAGAYLVAALSRHGDESLFTALEHSSASGTALIPPSSSHTSGATALLPHAPQAVARLRSVIEALACPAALTEALEARVEPVARLESALSLVSRLLQGRAPLSSPCCVLLATAQLLLPLRRARADRDADGMAAAITGLHAMLEAGGGGTSPPPLIAAELSGLLQQSETLSAHAKLIAALRAPGSDLMPALLDAEAALRAAPVSEEDSTMHDLDALAAAVSIAGVVHRVRAAVAAALSSLHSGSIPHASATALRVAGEAAHDALLQLQGPNAESWVEVLLHEVRDAEHVSHGVGVCAALLATVEVEGPAVRALLVEIPDAPSQARATICLPDVDPLPSPLLDAALSALSAWVEDATATSSSKEDLPRHPLLVAAHTQQPSPLLAALSRTVSVVDDLLYLRACMREGRYEGAVEAARALQRSVGGLSTDVLEEVALAHDLADGVIERRAAVLHLAETLQEVEQGTNAGDLLEPLSAALDAANRVGVAGDPALRGRDLVARGAHLLAFLRERANVLAAAVSSGDFIALHDATEKAMGGAEHDRALALLDRAKAATARAHSAAADLNPAAAHEALGALASLPFFPNPGGEVRESNWVSSDFVHSLAVLATSDGVTLQRELLARAVAAGDADAAATATLALKVAALMEATPPPLISTLLSGGKGGSQGDAVEGGALDVPTALRSTDSRVVSATVLLQQQESLLYAAPTAAITAAAARTKAPAPELHAALGAFISASNAPVSGSAHWLIVGSTPPAPPSLRQVLAAERALQLVASHPSLHDELLLQLCRISAAASATAGIDGCCVGSRAVALLCAAAEVGVRASADAENAVELAVRGGLLVGRAAEEPWATRLLRPLGTVESRILRALHVNAVCAAWGEGGVRVPGVHALLGMLSLSLSTLVRA